MDGVRKKRKLKFKRNIQKKQTQQNNFDEWFNELEFPDYNFSQKNDDENEVNEQVTDSHVNDYEREENFIQQQNEILEQTAYTADQLQEQTPTFDSYQKSYQLPKNKEQLEIAEEKNVAGEENYSEQVEKDSVENNFQTNNNFVDEKFNNFFEEPEEEKSSFSNSNLYKFSFKDEEPEKDLNFSLLDIFKSSQSMNLMPKSVYMSFATFVGIFALGFGLFAFVGKTFAVKENVMGAGERAVDSIKSAADHVSDKDFQSSEKAINEAYDEMVFASEEMNSINNMAIFVSEFIPGASQLSAGKNIVETGKYLTHAGKEANSLASVVNDIVNSEGNESMNDISLLQIYQDSMKHIATIDEDVKKANEYMAEVNLDDVPENYRGKFSDMKSILPHIEESLDVAVSGQEAIEDILGANGPRKYLFLFQNNHEMRATGGFIGSYGLLEISNGKITNFKIEGIFDPDGQLIDRVVPPLPVQKISADWSLHDSNWFPNFPTSAEKAIDFYERTGGPTVDGVITITPVVMRKILDVTGPIKLDEYDVEVSSDNFMQVIQNEVEEEYDKEENKPKKILSDLTPMVFDKILASKNPKNLAGIANVISKSLDERHILIYMRNDYIQEVVSQSGWSGEVIDTDKDYLSVINSNINGFKTDGVVDETIKHLTEIHEDGSVIDTVTITRKHEGGYTGFSWWDAVNADYMRIYVPKGSRLISVEGQTREINEERLDYDTLGYERDKDVLAEENSMVTDDDSGTRSYEENDKTVFANWVYVSPQETVTVTYKYILPFKVQFDQDKTGEFGSYATIYQKQSGSENSFLESEIILPENFETYWESDDKKDLKMKNELKNDLYHGVVFRVK